MSLFKKAEAKADRLKMYVYGKAGTGKTTTALHFPNPAVIDAEQGTIHYGDKFDFFRLETNDPKEVMTAIDELLKDPGDFKTLVIDPMTVIYDQIIQNREQHMKMKTGNLHYEIQPLDYKSIKTDLKLMMNKLLSLDMNIIVTARSKPLYAKGGKFMEEVGQQPDGHRDLPFMFDVVLELYEKDGKRMARVEKDRTNTLPHDFEFTYDQFVKHVGLDTLERDSKADRQEENLNHINQRNTKIDFEGDTLYTAGITAETLGRLQKLTEDVDQDSLIELLKDEYAVDSLLDLTEKAGRTLVTAIENDRQQED